MRAVWFRNRTQIEQRPHLIRPAARTRRAKPCRSECVTGRQPLGSSCTSPHGRPASRNPRTAGFFRHYFSPRCQDQDSNLELACRPACLLLQSLQPASFDLRCQQPSSDPPPLIFLPLTPLQTSQLLCSISQLDEQNRDCINGSLSLGLEALDREVIILSLV